MRVEQEWAFPLYIDYSKDERFENKEIQQLIDCYGDFNPEGFTMIRDDIIYLKVRMDAGSGFRLEYKYDKGKNDWYLINKAEYYLINEGLDEDEIPIPFEEKAEWFRDFSYQKLLGCE